LTDPPDSTTIADAWQESRGSSGAKKLSTTKIPEEKNEDPMSKTVRVKRSISFFIDLDFFMSASAKRGHTNAPKSKRNDFNKLEV
jgi:hypothetical protein